VDESGEEEGAVKINHGVHGGHGGKSMDWGLEMEMGKWKLTTEFTEDTG
jgi:hypothetical protein